MHYTNAFMLESFRIVSYVFFSVPHCATADIIIGDYIIPKGSGIFPSLISVMCDPKHFPGPHYLKPERFLDDNGRHKHHDHVIRKALLSRSNISRERIPRWNASTIPHLINANAKPTELSH